MQSLANQSNRTLGILLFDDVEVLDFCGSYEVFSVTKNQLGLPAFKVVTIAENPTITARNGLSVNCDSTLESAPNLDIILIPGGQGTRSEIQNPVLMDWIQQRVENTSLVLSVCTGALLLAKTGNLAGLRATTHANGYDALAQLSPTTKLTRDRVVDNGKFILSAGISAGIDMSFHVLAKLLGHETALQTAKYMEYDWHWVPSHVGW